MHKAVFFLLLLQSLFFFCAGQTALDVSQFATIDIVLKEKPDAFMVKGVSQVEVIDARPDDYCIGFLNKKSSNYFKGKKSGFAAIMVANSIAGELERYITATSANKDEGYRLLICLKECWLYENDYEIKQKDFNTKAQLASCGLLFRTDVYLEKDKNYIPLVKLDSIFHAGKDLRKQYDDLLMEAIGALSDKIKNCNLGKVYTKATKFRARNEIDSFYANMHKLVPFTPLDTAGQYIVEQFSDYKNQRFESTKLQYVSDKLGDYFYRKDGNGNEYPVTCFGLVTNGQLYLRTNNTYSIALFHKNRLYTIGSKVIVEKTTYLPMFLPLGTGINPGYYSYMSGAVDVNSQSARALQPMMVDLVTGKYY